MASLTRTRPILASKLGDEDAVKRLCLAHGICIRVFVTIVLGVRAEEVSLIVMFKYH